MTTTNADVTDLLSTFQGDPQQAQGVARFLGFDPIPNPQELLGGPVIADLQRFFRSREDQFGVNELYRVGTRDATPARAGLWIAVLSEWSHRSSDRERTRRRISRALAELVPERRNLAMLVPPAGSAAREAELIFPRTPSLDAESVSGQSITSIRALVDLNDPTRFHRDLLRDLAIPDGADLAQISRRWQEQFSVERAANRFYEEYASVRNSIADALAAANSGHFVVAALTQQETRAWTTRQMGRVLFLWFLQAKRWLGEPGGNGSPTYLRDLWNRRAESPEGEYYRGVLVPLFFEAMATGNSTNGEHPLLGYVPYLNGGLFRRDPLEYRINDAGEVSLPDDVFDPARDDSLLSLLSRYRFTTRESTPDDQSVDPDPELLGRVFENLYQGDERHDTGTYYTPREIVHFMCRQALDGYLKDATGVDQDTLEALRETAVGSRDDQRPLDGAPVDRLVDALETVRVCDPAVGSGAFLLGTIQEMVTLRRGILFSQREYVEPDELYDTVSDWKRRIIESSLYGVDINPEAVEICRLRLWLSLVLDLDKPPVDRDDWALPNLDFQILAGDSLVDGAAGITFVGSWPPKEVTVELDLRRRIERLTTNIRTRRQEFERTQRNPGRLRDLRDLIARDQREIAALKKSAKTTKAALARAGKRVDRIKSLLKNLESRDFALVQKPFLWPIAFPDVLRDGAANSGFDIVLANPPYVRMEKLDNEDEQAYGEAFPEVQASRADLLVYFYARALQILKPGGWLAFITSNKFMRAGYGRGIREHLTNELVIKRVIDFGDLPLFDANGKAIAAYPAVLVGQSSADSAENVAAVADLAPPIRQQLSQSGLKDNPENVRGVLENLDSVLSRNEIQDFPQAMLKKDGWVLEDPALIQLFDRLINQGKPLGEFVKGRLYMGVKTGLNEAFVIDQAKRDELIEEDPRSGEIIKPWLRGRDIRRWKAQPAGLYIIFTNRGVDIERYPAILEHLRWFRRFRDEKGVEKGLEKRATANVHPWYELQQPQEGIYHEFAAPKIMVNNVVKYPHFSYDESGAFISNACFFLVPPSPAIAAILNSRIGSGLLYRQCTLLQNGYVQVFLQFLERIPIPKLSRSADRRLSELVRALSLSGVNQKHEAEVESIVADAFGLTDKERILLEQWRGSQQSVFK